MLSLTEYRTIAQKIVNRNHKAYSKNAELIGNVTTAIARADQDYNSFVSEISIEGLRSVYANNEVFSYIRKQKRQSRNYNKLKKAFQVNSYKKHNNKPIIDFRFILDDVVEEAKEKPDLQSYMRFLINNSGLTIKQKKYIDLLVEGRKIEEIAKIDDVSIQNVYQTLDLAKVKMHSIGTGRGY